MYEKNVQNKAAGFFETLFYGCFSRLTRDSPTYRLILFPLTSLISLFVKS